jgi:hypothetical protein
MSYAFKGAEPKVVHNKDTYRPEEEEDDEDRAALNIMHDKRVFRGNTHGLNLLKQNMTPQQ